MRSGSIHRSTMPMLTLVEPEELEARKHLRHSGPVVDPQAKP